MGTKNFNYLDKLIAWMRLRKVLPFISKEDVVLDFGCGHQAYFLSHLANRIQSGIGIDYDATTRKISNQIETRRFIFKDTLPFSGKLFDKIFLLAVIEHIDLQTVPRLFMEFYRILKPGGKVVLTTPTPFGKLILEFLAFKLGLISKDEVGDHKKYYRKEDLDRIAKDHGFTVEKYLTFQFGGNSICVMKRL